MEQRFAIRNTLTEARVLWKNGVEFWIAQFGKPYWTGIMIDENWKRANPDVHSVDRLFYLFKCQLGKRPVFYVVK